VTERSFDSAKKRIATRAVMTIIVISLVFAGIVGVLWIGARDVRAEAMSVGELIQFLIYAIMVGGSVGALSEIWGELQRASGATERLVELLNIEDTVRTRPGPPLPQGGRGAIAFEDVVFHYPTRPESHALDGVSLHHPPG
jgi:ATP-binding cassette subfamily B protein